MKDAFKTNKTTPRFKLLPQEMTYLHQKSTTAHTNNKLTTRLWWCTNAAAVPGHSRNREPSLYLMPSDNCTCSHQEPHGVASRAATLAPPSRTMRHAECGGSNYHAILTLIVINGSRWKSSPLTRTHELTYNLIDRYGFPNGDPCRFTLVQIFESIQD